MLSDLLQSYFLPFAIDAHLQQRMATSLASLSSASQALRQFFLFFIIFCRLCNTIMFGMGPTDDPADGISWNDLISEENSLAKSNSSTDNG